LRSSSLSQGRILAFEGFSLRNGSAKRNFPSHFVSHDLRSGSLSDRNTLGELRVLIKMGIGILNVVNSNRVNRLGS